MQANTYNFRPEDSVLDACHTVTVTDPPVGMREMKQWCWDSRLELIWAELMDAVGINYHYDSVAVFYFGRGQDATLFRLRWA